ncbi:hypothetical protein RO3G_16817 [Rhizopus delemar RA 99-880]|uniref:Uncharacterized protein n=1 Tax=Rhizopus delemar (strain RA 99-880 / ATCC MYA-4621 / FGSC 9543 / NRRL 43880) TaxID=246409 RepID=I1CUH6_RHIO9|nr:hypothetical protein RO3G_16817 [Rhizopus delemar RA 99-880]|eukprot:EIE92106.1 hypothetical protein RO3G_16817 [Rhizopus delemar RA 99-880]
MCSHELEKTKMNYYKATNCIKNIVNCAIPRYVRFHPWNRCLRRHLYFVPEWLLGLSKLGY